MKYTKSIKITTILLIMSLSITACNKVKTVVDEDVESDMNEQVTITFFTTLPNRLSGQGLLEQTLVDQYMEENSNINIEVEALQGEAYKQKFRTYVASNELPDLLAVWGQASFLEAAIKNDYVAELDAELFTDYHFIDYSMKDFKYEDKLYGLPGSRDVTVIFYNKKLFDLYEIPLPDTVKKLQEAVEIFSQHDIEPLAINGKDKWILNLFFQDLVIKMSGNQLSIYNALDQNTTFSNDVDIRKAAVLMKELIDEGLFQESFMVDDYESARNLFLQGKAAMYYMGSWEIGMASNEDTPKEFIDNIRVLPFPTVEGGKGKITDLLAWYGGGYSVASNSEVKEETIKFLAYMLEPDNWGKVGWKTSTIVPPYDKETYLNGDENEIQTGVLNVLQSETSISGTPWNDHIAGEWKSDVENIILEFSVGTLTVDEFLNALDDAAAKGK